MRKKRKWAIVGFDVSSNPNFSPKSAGMKPEDIKAEEKVYEYEHGETIDAAIDKSNNNAVYLNNGDPICNEVSLAEMYRNYANSIACKLPNAVLPPWNEYSTYEDVARFCFNNKTFQQLHELELLEDRCISMGLDPTGGGLNFSPGTRLLSSSHRPYFNNGAPIPEAFQYDEERERMENFQQTGQFNARPVYQDINAAVVASFINPYQQQAFLSDYNCEFMMAVGQPIQHNYVTIPTPIDPNSVIVNTKCVLPNRLQDFVYVPECEVAPPKDNSPEELASFEKRKYAETHKQEIYNKLADLNLERQQVVQKINSPWVNNKYVMAELHKRVNAIDKEINDLASKSKVYTSRQEYEQEVDMLRVNYEIYKRNERLVNFEQRQVAKSNLRHNPGLADTVPLLDFDGRPVEREWFSEYGTILHGNDIDIFSSILNKRKEINTFAANFDRRQQMIDLQNMVCERAALVDEYEGNCSFEEAFNHYRDDDVFGFKEILKRPEFRTRASILEEEALRKEPCDFPDYVPMFDKREGDLDERERRLLMWHKRNKQLKAELEFAEAHPELKARKNRIPVIDIRRYPFTGAMLIANQSTEKDPQKRLKIFEKALNEGYAKAEAIKPPSNLERMYDHRSFNSTLQNYGLKTKIGSLSDLLAEYDTNDSFREAMNKGLINIGVPEDLGRSYNKDRVEFDNSIVQQFIDVKRPLPNDPDAHLKDPDYDTFHSTMTIEEITKEEYDKALENNKEYTMFVAPQLGGTYDAAKQHPSG